METKRKRALLARIEGQLAAMDSNDVALIEKRMLRARRALDALARLPRDAREAAWYAQIRRRFDTLAGEDAGQRDASLRMHRRMLARADCVLWQLYLRRHPEVTRAAA